MRVAVILGVLAVILMIVLATKAKAWPADAAAPAAATSETAGPATTMSGPAGPAEPPAVLAWSPGAFEWLSGATQASPGFVDPNRLDPRTPTGDPLLYRALPLGPRLSTPGHAAGSRW